MTDTVETFAAERMANQILQSRGYITLASRTRREVPSIAYAFHVEPFGSFACKIVLVTETDRADHLEQARIAGMPAPWLPDGCFFYRAVAE